MDILSLQTTDTVVLNDTSETAHGHIFDGVSAAPAEGSKKLLKKRKAKWANNHLDMVGWLEEVSLQRAEWETTAYKASNEQLYKILSICLDVYQQMKGRGLVELHQRRKLDEALTRRGFRYTEYTNLATKIVRLVFHTDRKRSHTYSRVVLFAHEHGVEAMRLPGWIAEQGGVEEVRRKCTNPLTQSEQNTQYKELAEEKLSLAPQLMEPFTTRKELQTSAEARTPFTLAIVRDNGDGTASIVFGINNETVIKAALIHAGKSLRESDSQTSVGSGRTVVKSARNEILGSRR